MRDRFFVEGVHAPGAHVRFAPDDARKLALVLRKRAGDAVEIVDSAGVAYEASIEIDGRDVGATLGAALPRGERECRLAVTLAQAIPKGAKMDYVVEKATELGVEAIVPLRSARVAGVDATPGKLDRWRRLARAAAQQSGRIRIPEIADVHDWDALLATFTRHDRVYVPWELAERRPLRETLDPELRGVRTVLAVVGPEGGFSAEEVERAQRSGARTVSLGTRVLRTETAALVLLSAARYAVGEI